MVDRGALHDRQVLLLPEKLRYSDAILVGAGMVGSWTALALARVVESLHVWDFDKVEVENVGCQAYNAIHVGRQKVDALAEIAFDPPIEPHDERFPPKKVKDIDLENTPVICSVDSIKGRKEVAEWCRANKVPFMVDTRVLGDLSCIVVTSPDTYDAYLKNLPKEDDVPNAPCGAVGTAYVGMHTAGQVVTTLSRWASENTIPYMRLWDVRFNTLINSKETAK
jgi:molybdopterin/thiamine biosynthesis adenylyltransferase